MSSIFFEREKLFIILLFLFQMRADDQSNTLKLFEVTFNPKEINEQSTLSINIFSLYEVIAGGFLVKMEETPFKFDETQNYTIIADCNNTEAETLLFSYTDNYLNITPEFSDLISTEIYLFTFKISKIQNPNRVYTIVFDLVKEGEVRAKSFFTFNLIMINDFNIETESENCGEITTYTFSLDNIENIASDSFLAIDFPYYNSEKDMSFFELGSEKENIKILNVKGMNPNSKIGEIFFTKISILSAYENGTYINEKSLSFSITNIKNPPSLRPIDGFSIFYHDSNHLLYMQSKELEVKCTVPNNITKFEAWFVNSNINTESSFIINLQTANFKNKDSVLEIEFPKEIILDINIIKNISIINQINSKYEYSIENQKFFLKDFIDSNNVGETHIFSINNLKTPPTSRPTSTFKVKIYDSSTKEYLMYTLKNEYNIKANPKNLNQINITLDNYQINKNVNLHISFITEDIIFKDSYLEIILPNELNAYKRNEALCSEKNLQTIFSNITCTVEENQKIIVSNIFQNDIGQNSKLDFYIDNILNFNKVYNTTSIKFYVKTFDDYNISKKEKNLFINFTSGNILNVTIERGSEKNYENTFYTFNFTNEDPIEESGVIIIILPKEISESNNNNEITQIQYFEINGNEILNYDKSFNKTQDGYYIILFNLNNIEAKSNISITISDIVNARSFKPIIPIKIDIYSENQSENKKYLIDELKYSNSLNFTNSESLIFNKISISSSSITTGELSNYIFEFITNSLIYDGDYIIISIPNDIHIDSENEKYINITCEGYNELSYNLTIEEIKKENNGNNIKVILDKDKNLEEAIPIGTNLTITVNNLINPNSVKSISNFNFSLYTYDNYPISSSNGNLKVDIKKAHQYNNIQIYPEKEIMNYISNYTFIIKPYFTFEDGDYILINFPEEIFINDTECNIIPIKNLNENINCEILENSENKNQTIKISQIFNAINNQKEEIKFVIQNIKNIIEKTDIKESEIINVTTYNILNEEKENSENNILKIKYSCNYPCELCSKENENKCLKCIDIENKYFLNNNCLSKCPENYFQNEKEKICIKCEEGCLECLSSDINKCTKCLKNFYLDLKNNKCLNECPIGTFLNEDLMCDSCSNNCKKCYGNKFNCTECHSFYTLTPNNLCFLDKSFFQRINLLYQYSYQHPFDYYIIPLFIILCCLGLLIQKCFYNEMVLLGALIAFLSIMFKIIIILLYIFSYITGEKIYFGIFALILVFSFQISNIFIFVYFFYTLYDEEYKYWISSNCCIKFSYSLLIIIFDYKCSRFFYCRMTNNKFFNIRIHDYNRIHKPYKKLIYFDLLLVHVLCIFNSVLVIIGYKPYSFLNFLCFYQIFVSTLIIIFSIIDYISIPDFNNEFYNQKKIKPQIMPNTIIEENYGGIYSSRITSNYNILKKSNLDSSSILSSNQKFLQNNLKTQINNKNLINNLMKTSKNITSEEDSSSNYNLETNKSNKMYNKNTINTHNFVTINKKNIRTINKYIEECSDSEEKESNKNEIELSNNNEINNTQYEENLSNGINKKKLKKYKTFEIKNNYNNNNRKYEIKTYKKINNRINMNNCENEVDQRKKTFKRVYSHKNIHTRKIENTLENNNLNNSMNMGFNIKSGKDYNNFEGNYDEIIQKNYKTHNLNRISNEDLNENSEKNSINYTINNMNNKLISFGNSDYKFKTENVSNRKLIKRDSLDIEELNTIKFNKISDFNISNNEGDLINEESNKNIENNSYLNLSNSFIFHNDNFDNQNYKEAPKSSARNMLITNSTRRIVYNNSSNVVNN